ncbi:MAG: flagellar motor protein [Planctomycetes bacterium]|nr:flagellar motor protein [Planctomycetota bacterium]
MELFTVAGIVVAFIGVIGGMVVEGGHPTALISLPSFMIVMVGSLGALLIATPMSDLKHGLNGLKEVFLPPKFAFQETMEKILELANLARREGLLALESYTTSADGDPFLKSCLTLAIDGSSAEAIRDTVETQMMISAEDYKAGSKFWANWAAYAPTVGVLGAVLGLIHVMQVLDKPELIGPGIAVAFVATVYGVGFANVICLPFQAKLNRQNEHRQLLMAMTLEGVVGIQSGLAPGALRSRLSVYCHGHGGKGKDGH